MNILEKIIARKQVEVAAAKQLKSIAELETAELFSRGGLSLATALKNSNHPGIIAEFKRKSPSKGIINADVVPEKVTTDYTAAGAVALSVLTDTDFFGGSFGDFTKSRWANPSIPMLRKDFIIDEYQLYEAKALGADIILLIAACLQPDEIKNLGKKAHELDLEVLLEVHDAEELSRSLCEVVDIVGVNNRNLKTFETSIETSIQLNELIPSDFVKISESGLSDADTIFQLFNYGFKGFLMGESFMKTADPGNALASLQTNLSLHNHRNPIVL